MRTDLCLPERAFFPDGVEGLEAEAAVAEVEAEAAVAEVEAEAAEVEEINNFARYTL